MKRWFALLILPLMLLSGCCSHLEDELAIQVARNKILNGEATCVLVTEEGMFTESGRGIVPLLTMYDKRRTEMEGARIVDKVIGRATAAIAVCGKVRHLHAELISEDAIELLEAHGIYVTYTQCVPRILNRKLDGLCPMELAVEGIDNPERAVEALRAKLETFKTNP